MKKKQMVFIIALLQSMCDSMLPSDAIVMMMKQNISAYPYEELEWPANDARLKEFLDCVVDAQTNLQEYSKRCVAFSMLDRCAQQHPLTKHVATADTITWSDLGLFCGQTNPLHYLADIVDRTQTIFGRVNLYGMLALPTCDATELLHKQTVVKELLAHPELMEGLQKELITCKSVENNLLTFWMNDPFRQVTARKYFNYSVRSVSDFCNKSSLILNIRSVVEHEQRILMACATAIAAGLLPVYGVSKIAQANILPEKLNMLSEKLYSSGGPLFGLLQYCSDHPYSVGGFAIISGIISALYVTESVEWAYDNFILDQLVHDKMKGVATALRSLRRVYILLNNNEHLKHLLADDYCHLQTLFDTTLEREVQSFLKMLSSHRFHHTSSFFINTGHALVAFKMFSKIKAELELPLMALGRIDAHVSIAQLYNEHEHTNNPYCFARCHELDHPMIDVQDFWNPCIKAKVIVPNSVSLGVDQPINMIITGPNAGGKSTLLKGLGSAIVLTQGLGITPARRADITIFSMILTYLNIVDDLAGGNSLFKNQVLRMQKIFNLVKALQSGQQALVLLDEMFNGTAPQEAEACAYGVAYLLGQQSNVVNIIATHYKNLTQLPYVLDSYKNYHVSVSKEFDGTIKYPFKLEEGISDQHVALDILASEGFNIPFIRKGQSMLQENYDR